MTLGTIIDRHYCAYWVTSSQNEVKQNSPKMKRKSFPSYFPQNIPASIVFILAFLLLPNVKHFWIIINREKRRLQMDFISFSDQRNERGDIRRKKERRKKEFERRMYRAFRGKIFWYWEKSILMHFSDASNCEVLYRNCM